MASEEETVKQCQTVAEATREGKLDEIKRLIAEGHPVDGKDNRGWRPVHEAASKNFTDCLTFLLEQEETDVNAGSFEGCTALYLAVQNKHVDSVKILLEHKADPNLGDNFQVTPLFKAVEVGSLETVQLLVENGAHVNSQNFNDSTPLHKAAANGKAEIVEYLLEQHARLDLCEEYHITPVFAAAQYGYPKCLHLMLKAAVKRGELSVVDVCASDGASPLFLAAQEGHAACIRLLLHYNANANLMIHKPRALPLHAAIQFARLECMELLLGHTEQTLLSRCDANLWEVATGERHGLIIQRLIALGLNTNARLPVPEESRFRPRSLAPHPHVHFSRRVGALGAVALYRHPIANAEVLLRRTRPPRTRLDYAEDESNRGRRSHPRNRSSQDGGSETAGEEDHESSNRQVGSTSAAPASAYPVPPLLPAIDAQSYGLAELLVAYGARVDLEHPLVVGNMVLIVAFPWWKGLTMLLKCGAPVESLFRHRRRESIILGGGGDENEEDGEVTEPESSDEDGDGDGDGDEVEVPESPSKRRRPSRYAPLTLYDTLRAASFANRAHDHTPGKILYRLLQFAGNVSLAPELESLLDAKPDWNTLLAITENPRSLKHYCRCVVRKALGSQNLLKIDPVTNLPLPSTLTEYLLYADMD